MNDESPLPVGTRTGTVGASPAGDHPEAPVPAGLTHAPSLWSRRDVLRALVAAAGVPALGAGAAPRRVVGILGGGMAGVSLAWLLDGERDVVLLEARESIGGNVQSIEVELDGHTFVVDMGAQYFHPGPYPLYTRLLIYLGLHPPDPTQPSTSYAFPASITLAADSEPTPRFVSPVLPERAWSIFAPWNWAGLRAFAVGFEAAKIREQRRGSWAVTLEDWLPTLGLSPAQWEGMLLPWAASLFSGCIEQARGLSARAAMIFAAKALPANPLAPILYYTVKAGMAEALRRMIEQCSTLEVRTSAAAEHVSRPAHGGFRIHCAGGRTVDVDDLVFASSGPATRRLLEGLPGAGAQRAALGGIEFHEARLALHTDPLYAPANPDHWSFLNCAVQGGHCEASMWLAGVLPLAPPEIAARLWKSWITHRRQPPTEILHEAEFSHMLPTPATLRAQIALRTLQGREGLWFAGGYLLPYDSQETALRSALGVALGLGAISARGRALLQSDEEEQARAGRDPGVP